jgi:hypothetical protein
MKGKEVKDSIRFKCKLSFTSPTWNFSTTFYSLPLGDWQLILGMPWLHEANPNMIWKSLSITDSPRWHTSSFARKPPQQMM